MALAAKHSWWEEAWRWEIALRVLVLSGGQRLETAFYFWRVVSGVRRFTQPVEPRWRLTCALISALEGGIGSSHLRPECNLALSPSPRAHMLKLAATVALRLNNVAAGERSTAPTAPQSLPSWMDRCLLDTGAAQSRRLMAGTDSGCTDTDAGWLVIGNLN